MLPETPIATAVKGALKDISKSAPEAAHDSVVFVKETAADAANTAAKADAKAAASATDTASATAADIARGDVVDLGASVMAPDSAATKQFAKEVDDAADASLTSAERAAREADVQSVQGSANASAEAVNSALGSAGHLSAGDLVNGLRLVWAYLAKPRQMAFTLTVWGATRPIAWPYRALANVGSAIWTRMYIPNTAFKSLVDNGLTYDAAADAIKVLKNKDFYDAVRQLHNAAGQGEAVFATVADEHAAIDAIVAKLPDSAKKAIARDMATQLLRGQLAPRYAYLTALKFSQINGWMKSALNVLGVSSQDVKIVVNALFGGSYGDMARALASFSRTQKVVAAVLLTGAIYGFSLTGIPHRVIEGSTTAADYVMNWFSGSRDHSSAVQQKNIADKADRLAMMMFNQAALAGLVSPSAANLALFMVAKQSASTGMVASEAYQYALESQAPSSATSESSSGKSTVGSGQQNKSGEDDSSMGDLAASLTSASQTEILKELQSARKLGALLRALHISPVTFEALAWALGKTSKERADLYALMEQLT